MPRTTLTPVSVPTPYAIVPVEAVFTVGDQVNGNQFVSTGRELVLVRNTDAGGAHTVTVTSVANSKGRTGHITAFSVPASKEYILPFFAMDGWKQTNGYIYLDMSTTDISFCVQRLP